MASPLPAIDHSSSLKGRCITLLQGDQNTSCWQAGQKRSQNIFSWGGQDEIHFLGFQIFPYDMHLHTFQESFQNLPGTVTLSRLTWSHHSMTVHWHCPSLTLPLFSNRRALRMVDICARACAIHKGPVLPQHPHLLSLFWPAVAPESPFKTRLIHPTNQDTFSSVMYPTKSGQHCVFWKACFQLSSSQKTMYNYSLILIP